MSVPTDNNVIDIIRKHLKKMGGTKGNFEGDNPSNEILICLKDVTKDEYDLLKEELIK